MRRQGVTTGGSAWGRYCHGAPVRHQWFYLDASLRDADGTTYAELVMPETARRGEPWLTCLAPDDMSALLDGSGFGRIEHVRQRDAVDAAVWNRSDSLRPIDLSVIARATVSGSS